MPHAFTNQKRCKNKRKSKCKTLIQIFLDHLTHFICKISHELLDHISKFQIKLFCFWSFIVINLTGKFFSLVNHDISSQKEKVRWNLKSLAYTLYISETVGITEKAIFQLSVLFVRIASVVAFSSEIFPQKKSENPEAFLA